MSTYNEYPNSVASARSVVSFSEVSLTIFGRGAVIAVFTSRILRSFPRSSGSFDRSISPETTESRTPNQVA